MLYDRNFAYLTVVATLKDAMYPVSPTSWPSDPCSFFTHAVSGLVCVTTEDRKSDGMLLSKLVCALSCE
jgi:hypothetical protein